MQCDLCMQPASRLHRMIVRPDVAVAWDVEPGPDEEYRERVVCGACRDELIGNETGTATIGGREFSVAGISLAGGGT